MELRIHYCNLIYIPKGSVQIGAFNCLLHDIIRINMLG